MHHNADAVRDLDFVWLEDGRAQATMPADYVYFRGHFEGQPLVPGVVQLTEIVLPIARTKYPALGRLRGLRRLRFRRPILPGETLIAAIDGPADTVAAPAELKFALWIEGAVAASGMLSFAVEPSA